MTKSKQPSHEGTPAGDEALNADFHRALASLGWRLPDTEDEIAEASKWVEEHPPAVPAHAADPAQALARPRPRAVPLRPVSLDAEDAVEENLSRAAREGDRIPNEIEERMRRDRDDAEREIDTP